MSTKVLQPLGVAVSFTPRADGAGTEGDGEGAEEGAPEGDTPVELFEPETAADAGADGESADEARLVVFGDLDFAAAQIGSANNVYLVLNTFNWLVQREQLISIDGRKPEETKLFLTSSELLSVLGLVMLLMPGLAIVAGVSVFMRRRR